MIDSTDTTENDPNFYNNHDPGRTDNQWTAAARFDIWQQSVGYAGETDAADNYGGDTVPQTQADLASTTAPATPNPGFSGVLSQSDLAK